MTSWFGWGSSSSSSNNNNNNKPEETTEETSNTSESGMFSGAMSYMKGLLGIESLKVEEAGEDGKKPDPDAEKRKGLFKTLSSFIGKDITSMVSLPVWAFEPTSFLQVMSEPLQYDEVLKNAAKERNQYLRLAYVAGFPAGLYYTAIRTRKPFNPLLGETFEIVSPRGFKFIAEQVSHHPPIGVSETESDEYILQLETEIHTKFYGNSSEVILHGINHLDLKPTGEHFTWGHLHTVCHNIVIGSIWLDHYGDLEITNHTTGDKCILKFTKCGWLGVGRYQITGEIVDKDGTTRVKLHGHWNEHLKAALVGEDGSLGEEVVVWAAKKEVITSRFGFTKFVEEEVVNITPELLPALPKAPYLYGPTDSRLREDRRLLEEGDLDSASKAKYQMEEVQRAKRREREAKAEPWETRYFKKVEDPTFDYRWKFNGKYWTDREERLKAAATENKEKQENQ